jgi:hypothetical protein
MATTKSGRGAASRKGAMAEELKAFTFPLPAPDHTPESLTPVSSQTDMTKIQVPDQRPRGFLPRSQEQSTPEHTPKSLTPVKSRINLDYLQKSAQQGRPLAASTDIIDFQHVDSLPTIPRYHNLLRQARTLVQAHGRHTTQAGTTIFTRAPVARDSTKQPTAKDLAVSLAAAQDSIGVAHLDGPAKDDLAVFKRLWDTTVDLLEEMIRSGDLSLEAFGWGMFGLSIGYTNHILWNEDTEYLANKTRLHDALVQLPSMDSTKSRGDTLVVRGGDRIQSIARVNRQVYTCGHLLLQQFRREDWKRIRWFHGVAVAQRWMGSLGFVAGDEDEHQSVDLGYF